MTINSAVYRMSLLLSYLEIFLIFLLLNNSAPGSVYFESYEILLISGVVRGLRGPEVGLGL